MLGPVAQVRRLRLFPRLDNIFSTDYVIAVASIKIILEEELPIDIVGLQV